MSVKERMIQFLNYKEISQSKFEQKVSLSNGFVNNIGDSIRAKSINKIKAVYPELNTSWLLTGEGEMISQIISEPEIEYLKKRIKDLETIVELQKTLLEKKSSHQEGNARAG